MGPPNPEQKQNKPGRQRDRSHQDRGQYRHDQRQPGHRVHRVSTQRFLLGRSYTASKHNTFGQAVTAEARSENVPGARPERRVRRTFGALPQSR